MDKTTIQTLIDKVIVKKGLIRVPSWWMRKVLMQIADWVQERDDANGKKIVKAKEETDVKIEKVKEEANGKITTLDNNTKTALVELKKSLHTQRCIMVKTGANAGYVVIDGIKQDIPANTQKIITYVDTFSFYNKGTTNKWLIFIGLAVADTSSITDMSYMFNSCSRLTSLDLSGLDTSAVTNMSHMFYTCSGLTSLDLSNFDTSKAIIDSMFVGCSAIISLILGPNFFKTSKTTFLDFSSCTKWTNDTVVTSLVTNSYDRATAGLSTMTLQLSANTKAALSDEQKAAITAKGYTIS